MILSRLIKLWILMILMLCSCFPASEIADDPWQKEREKMVSYQLKARGIQSKTVLDAMNTVERHLFVPLSERGFAYGDHPLPIGEGQTISQPYIVAYMTEQLNIKKGDKVLEIGTGSGYQAAILGLLTDSVFSIEIHSNLAQNAQNLLDSLGYHQIFIREGNGYEGWKEHAPFQGILVTCSPDEIPQALKEQLSEMGRMVIPVDYGIKGQLLHVFEKRNGELKSLRTLPVRFVPMLKP